MEQFPNCGVILIVNEESVAKHFVEHLEANEAYSHPLTKASDYYGYVDNNKEAPPNMFLSIRTDITMKEEDCLPSQYDTCSKIYLSSPRGVISVWGIAGVGKSALVRSIFTNPHLIKYTQRISWVDVPAGPFDLVEFSRLLLLNFHRCDLEAMEAATIGILQGQDPLQACCEILRHSDCVVIIDDLRSTYDWDMIEAAFLFQPTRNARIIVITSEESIAKHIVKQQADQMINLKCLRDNEACEIFKKIIDPNGTELASQMGNTDIRKLVAKCGGLPKIVSAIGKVPWSFLKHMNDDFMVKLENDPQFRSLSSLLSWMHSYFNACSDLVKPCIFYLSVFPASSNIRKGRLLRRWIAEGYSRDTPGCTARENAEKRFFELVELSIIQQATNQVICQVNGFFREYIISRRMEDNLVFALEGRCSRNTLRTGQHLTLMADWQRDQNVFESIDFARLRSLTTFGKWCSFFISDKMRRLRVLDLEDIIAVTNDDIEQIFVKLLSLKFISLRGCRKISRLPDTLGGLRQLETLDVRFTSIVMLPSAIIKLQKLQYIRAGSNALPDEDWTLALAEDGDVVTNQLPATTSEEVEGHDSSISSGRPAVPTCTENAESPAQATTSQEAQHRPMLPKVGRLTSKLSHTWSLCGSKPKKEAQHHNGGVGVPVGIESLTALHTVGVVNVNASGGEAFLKQVAKLTQLLKLRVCGVNKKNWEQLCSALLDKNCHLESLSVRFHEDCLDNSFKPPKTLKSLKLYGPMKRLPDTIQDLVNLKNLDLEMTITRPEDMQLFLEDKLPRNCILNRLCMKVEGNQKLDFSSQELQYLVDKSGRFQPRVLKFDCSSKLEVTLKFPCILTYVEVLIIQCSQGSFFRLTASHRIGLFLSGLKTVWLKGSYSEEQRVHLKELVDGHYKKPVLKLEPLQ